MQLLIRVILPIVLAVISAVVTIKVADISSRGAAKEKDQPAPTIASAPSPAQSTAGGTGEIGLGKTIISAQENGLLLISANATANAGGEFRSYLDLVISVNGKRAGQARSYVPVNWGVGHIVNASAIVPVTKGKVDIEISASGEGLKEQATAGGTYVIMPVPQ